MYNGLRKETGECSTDILISDTFVLINFGFANYAISYQSSCINLLPAQNNASICNDLVFSEVSATLIHHYFEGRSKGNIFRLLRISYHHLAANSESL